MILYFLVVSPVKKLHCLAANLSNGISLYLSPSAFEKTYIKAFNLSDLSIDFCQGCLKHCADTHTQIACHSDHLPITQVSVPIYLIDVKSACLVRKTTDTKYASLSYVWGVSNSTSQQSMWTCSKSTLPMMQEPGFFDKNASMLPETILQAIDFTRKMDLRYLWIDRFCIIQDDEIQKHDQLQAMGSIYYHSFFVIVAADGDIDHGIRRNESRIRRAPRPCPSILANLIIKYEPPTHNTLWSTRGWTFQEQMFARRAFIFRSDTVIFQCQGSVWQEGTMEPILRDGSGVAKLTLHKWPNLLYFKDLVEAFSTREMTYPCDSLNAFAGVLNVLEASFSGGFLFGLPEICFDTALLWQSKGPLKDRVLLSRSEGKPSADLPSWSWVRWKGALDFTAWEGVAECLLLSYYNQNICSTKRIVQWQKVSRLSGEAVPLADCYSSGRPMAQNDALPPPPGWKRNPLVLGTGEPSTLSSLLGSTHHVFTHESLGDYPQFRFPVPMEASAPGGERSWKSVIQGRVQRAFLVIEPCRPESHSDQTWHVVSWKLPHGEKIQVGVVRLHDQNLEYWSAGEVVGEFIAISAGEFIQVPGRSVGISMSFFDAWEIKQQSNSGHVYQFYNVMLIKRRDGIAVRKGLGRVECELWKSLNAEEIDVKLR